MDGVHHWDGAVRQEQMVALAEKLMRLSMKKGKDIGHAYLSLLYAAAFLEAQFVWLEPGEDFKAAVAKMKRDVRAMVGQERVGRGG